MKRSWYVEIRSTNLLSVSKSGLKSVDSIVLDYDLTNLKYNANENYNNYKESYVRNGKFGCEIKIPIFMTPAERELFNKIENTKKRWYSRWNGETCVQNTW